MIAMVQDKLIGLCSDHAGYDLKEHLKQLLEARGYAVRDFGCPSAERCDYPDFAHPMGHAIQAGELQRGISVCGSGTGISLVMNPHLSLEHKGGGLSLEDRLPPFFYLYPTLCLPPSSSKSLPLIASPECLF